MDELDGEVFFPRQAYCTDNGAMVAYAGFLHMAQKKWDSDWSIQVQARVDLSRFG